MLVGDVVSLYYFFFSPSLVLSKHEKNMQAIYHIERIHTAK